MALTPFLTLTRREVHRFLKLWMDTLITPIVSTLLFLAMFAVITGGQDVAGIPYMTFVFSGLITMNVLTGSFSNPAFALVIARNTGTFLDLQIAPLRPWMIGTAYALAAALRAMIILAITLAITFWWLPEFRIESPFLFLAGAATGGLLFGMVGVLFGMWATRFESLPFITSFVLQPLLFLGGTFYPISNLPEPFRTISEWNPVHHLINISRHALLGYSDVSPALSWTLALICVPVLWLAMTWMMTRKLQQ